MEKGRKKVRLALYSVLVGIALTAMKLVAGLLSGSLGILSEALHSFLDLGAAVITFFSVRLSARPPDSCHPYGHGKIENLSALAQAMLLFVTCAWIVYEAVGRLLGKSFHVEATFLAFAVMGVSLLLDVVISRLLYRGARKYASQALEADALHYSSDILSSGVVIAGLVGIRLGFKALDPIAALGVAVLVIAASCRLGKRAVDELLDKAPPGLAEEITRRIDALDDLARVEKIRVRRSGSSVFVDLVVSAPRRGPLGRGHEAAERVEAEVKRIVPGSDIMVHIHDAREGEDLVEAVRDVAARFSRIQDVHNLKIFRDDRDGRYFLSLHAKVDPSLSFEEAHAVMDGLEKEIEREVPGVKRVETHLETADAPRDGTNVPLPPDQAERLSAEVLKDERVREIHDLQLLQTEAGTVLSCHVVMKRTLPIEAVHEVSTAVEEKARSLFSAVTEVVVHAEPFVEG